MTKEERMKEIAKASPNFGKRVGYKMCVVDELHDMKELETQIQVGRMNGKGRKCLEALLTLEVIKSASTELLLKELKDRGVISSWYYNGSYHIGSELPKE